MLCTQNLILKTVWNKMSVVASSWHCNVMFSWFVDELWFLIKQPRCCMPRPARWEKVSLGILTWSLSPLQEQSNLSLTSPRLPLLNRLQTHLSAAADWPSLSRTKSPSRGRRCWVSVISRPGEICRPVHLLFKGMGALLSEDALHSTWPISPCLDNRRLFPTLLCDFKDS